jgi:hypothetical protein
MAIHVCSPTLSEQALMNIKMSPDSDLAYRKHRFVFREAESVNIGSDFIMDDFIMV